MLNPFSRLFLIASATVVALGIASSAAAAEDVALPTPLPDSFYDAPANLGDFENGEIIASRAMPVPPRLFDVQTFQLQFRTTDMYDRPIAAVTTVLLPNNRRPNAPLLSIQDIVNAMGLECAPSQQLYASTTNVDVRSGSLTASQRPLLNGLLQQGWILAIPDHLGPRSSYGAAQLGGRITLDGVKAVQNFSTADVAKSKVGLIGYSGGGMATAWASALAPTYAPGLKISGSAYGGAPMNLIKMGEGLGIKNAHPAFGLAFAAAMGLSREYPNEIPMWGNLTTTGKALFTELQNACTNEILLAGLGHRAEEMTPDVGIFDDPAARRVVKANSLEFYPGTPNAPVFEWHSPIDNLIPVDSIEITNRRYCNAGVDLVSVPAFSPDHLSSAVVGLPPALAWMNDRFAGAPAPSTC